MVIIHDHGQVTFELMITLSQLFIAVDIWLTNVQAIDYFAHYVFYSAVRMTAVLDGCFQSISLYVFISVFISVCMCV